MENENLNQLEVAQRNYESWEFPKKTKLEQIEWFQENVIREIAYVTLNSINSPTPDRVEEVIVHEDLIEVVNEAMHNAVLPDDVEQPGVTREQLATEFASFCKSIPVRAYPLDKFVLPVEANLPAENQFIRIITTTLRTAAILDRWDQSIGFTQSLIQRGTPILPTLEEKKMLFFLHQLLSLVANRPPTPTQPGVSSTPQFFPK